MRTVTSHIYLAGPCTVGKSGGLIFQVECLTPGPGTRLMSGPGGRFTNIPINLCYEWQPYLRYVKSYGRSALS